MAESAFNLRDLQKVCQAEDSMSEDPKAPDGGGKG